MQSGLCMKKLLLISINGFNANDRHGQEEKKGMGQGQTLFGW